MPKMPKMTMKQWEKTKADKRADKVGRHGPEGSKKDIKADKREIQKINRKRGYSK